MLRLAVRSARAHWRRFVLTTVAIVVGVSFVTGSFVLTDSLAASIDSLLASATGQTDFVVRAADSTGERGGRGGGPAAIALGTRGGLPSELTTALAAVEGVAALDPSVVGAAQLLDKGGNAKGFDVTALSNWPDHPDMGAVQLISGVAPGADGDVVIDTATATQRGLAIGRRVRIGTRRGVITATIVGTAQRGSGQLGAAGGILAFTLPRATALVGTPDRIDSISIRLTPGADRSATRERLSAAAGPSASVLDADTLLADARQRVQDQLANFNALMLGFASVTLFVSAFLIWNTFSIVVAQRRRELALLRAIGAGTRQVFASVVSEALIVAVAASVIGIGAGVAIAIGLRTLLSRFGVELPSSELVLAPRTILVAIGVGVGVTLVSVAGPARRTTRIPPIAALQSASLPPARSGRRSTWIGLGFVIVGLAIGATGLASPSLDTAGKMARVGLGGLLLVIGATVLSRYLTPPVVGAIGAPLHRFGGVPSALARRNAVRDPQRTATTAAALMIGLALVATTLVLGESVKTAFGGALRASIRSDIVVDAGGIVPFDAATVGAITKAKGVTAAVPLTFARADLAGASIPPGATGNERNGRGSRVGITVGDPTALERSVDPAFTNGRWPREGELAVASAFATEHRLSVGSDVTIGTQGVTRTLQVSGIYQRDELLDDAVSLPTAVAGIPGVEPITRQVLVDASDTSPTTLAAITKSIALVPNSSAFTADAYVADQTSAFDIVLGIVNVLLLFAVAVAGLGIANTLALSIVERTRELGLLRAVGMTRRSMRRMIRVEGNLVACLGGVLGVGLGVAFGIATAAALPADTAALTIPWNRLVGVLLAAGLLGLVASAVPARRAARLDVLDAISQE